MSTLASPLILPSGAQLKNRIAKAAMSENMADSKHRPGVEFENLYRKWAQGGAGLVISGNIMVDSRALGESNNVVVEKSIENEDFLIRWAIAGSANQTALWAQLNHPGKQTPKFLCKDPVAPSAVPYPAPMNRIFATPRALKASEILDIISRFAYAAERLKNCGFSGIQIHGAHGYLVSQFLSPHHNQRTDEWGGSLENRLRFALEIYRAIRAKVGAHFPIGIKLNSADFMRGGFSEEESMQVVDVFSKAGIDLIEISGGTYEAAVMMGKKTTLKKSTEKREAYFLAYCEKVATLTSTPIMLTGGFRTRQAMDAALVSGACQVIGLARSIAVASDFPNQLLTNKNCISQVHPITTGFKSIDKLFPLEITWYTQQLHRMGRGKSPKPTANAKISILKSLFSYGIQGLSRVRTL
jgi:2,4-dienoyl-CoA reductase-like NADH-dependent reductase (Old Yellow Enzyme family)